MASERECFDLSGPLHLTFVDWDHAYHRMSVAASLVQGVYILERDRQENRMTLIGPSLEPFISPQYVIAFRGTLTKADSVSRDIELDIHFIRNGLNQTSRSDIAIQAARNMVATVGDSNIWLAGHSLGSAMAMLTGKRMAKSGMFIESFLFNPPFVSAPIERIKDKNLKLGLRIAGSVITAGLTLAMKAKQKTEGSLDDQLDPFAALSARVPCLFVNPSDHICSEYIGYFEHRNTMEELGAGEIEMLATQNSIGGLLIGAFGKESEAVHLIPSASFTVNLTPVEDFKAAHSIHQWWKPRLSLEHKLYKYK